MKHIPNPYGREGCFFCGPTNPVGLKLNFYETDGQPHELVCTWVPTPVFKGFGRVLHGGIQSGLFDEIMGWTAFHLTKKVGLTGQLNVRFLKPLFIEQEIEVRCRIESHKGSRVSLTAEIKDSRGEICTTATGTYVLMEPEKFTELVGDSRSRSG